MSNAIFVFLGGGLGSLLRYLVQVLCTKTTYPIATIIVNVVGCFLIGVASAVISHYLADTALGEKLRLFIMVGVCGGFTTFSTFCNDAITLGRTNIYASILYVGLSIVIGFVAVMLGYEIRRFF